MSRTTDDQRWAAVQRRDHSQDGRFFTGVTTTGIFCRPSCPARHPLRKNVRFFATAEEAQQAGLRACKRCKPLDRVEDERVQRVRELCEHVRANCDSGEPLTLAALSERSGLSPSRLRHLFRDIVGMTPRQYVEACRYETLKSGLRRGDSVSRAIHDAGFNTMSRVYETAGSRLGMTPSEYGAGGRGLHVTCASTDTVLGRLIVAATERGPCFIQFGRSIRELRRRLREEYPAAEVEEVDLKRSPRLAAWLDTLRDHLAGKQPHLDLPLDVRATAFQLEVWRYLQTIPPGETRTYSQVATAIGRPKAVRAVANACASNPVALAVPCHRVVRSDGTLGGYRWGTDRKATLLERERAVAESVSAREPAGSRRRRRS
ncbi:MAG: bifunctional DNA-binding transcriptional regulator/O6-methylguanine-DNA methyltransferase Ada [Acidobacteriota bacterium]